MSSEIFTYTGKVVDPFNLNINDIDINDISHALSMTCRFCGHCNKFYSVAQHSVIISRFASKENKLWGLLHDATEAYFGDLPSPIKKSIPFYKDAEIQASKIIAKKFNLPESIPDEIHSLDKRLLLTESFYLMPKPIYNGEYDIDPLHVSDFICLSPDDSQMLFKSTFFNLINKKNK